MNRFVRSVGAQLSLALLLVVAIALGVVYLTVVPSLRERAIDTRVADMTRIAAKLRPQANPLTDEWVATASEENGGVRVVLLNRLAPSGLVVPYRDSWAALAPSPGRSRRHPRARLGCAPARIGDRR
jgi:hypothetical protein